MERTYLEELTKSNLINGLYIYIYMTFTPLNTFKRDLKVAFWLDLINVLLFVFYMEKISWLTGVKLWGN